MLWLPIFMVGMCKISSIGDYGEDAFIVVGFEFVKIYPIPSVFLSGSQQILEKCYFSFEDCQSKGMSKTGQLKACQGIMPKETRQTSENFPLRRRVFYQVSGTSLAWYSRALSQVLQKCRQVPLLTWALCCSEWLPIPASNWGEFFFVWWWSGNFIFILWDGWKVKIKK
ncbi:hypothetical protein CEXT_430611 [Caerostris extrusa]|uniref:Uncharacterized protein n=1 Tax=Caerostris extrusa TaxID=172846 RepID=A0AAV4V9F9_CAEEX|nr:hypothetical protein CEXT_430611 [Caerostris extrusa]